MPSKRATLDCQFLTVCDTFHIFIRLGQSIVFIAMLPPIEGKRPPGRFTLHANLGAFCPGRGVGVLPLDLNFRLRRYGQKTRHYGRSAFGVTNN